MEEFQPHTPQQPSEKVETKKQEVPHWEYKKYKKEGGILSRQVREKRGLPLEGQSGLSIEDEYEIKKFEGGSGKIAERKVMSAFVDRQFEWPEWLQGMYKATDKENHEKKDIMFVTDRGNVYVQVKNGKCNNADRKELRERNIVLIEFAGEKDPERIYNEVLKGIKKRR